MLVKGFWLTIRKLYGVSARPPNEISFRSLVPSLHASLSTSLEQGFSLEEIGMKMYKLRCLIDAKRPWDCRVIIHNLTSLIVSLCTRSGPTDWPHYSRVASVRMISCNAWMDSYVVIMLLFVVPAPYVARSHAAEAWALYIYVCVQW